jgi:hypothetical protein
MRFETIDTRDLVKELRDLEAEIESQEDGPGDTSMEEKRAQEIRDLFEEIAQYADESPEDGIFQLIEDSGFSAYAEELADDLGTPVSTDWPYCHIDWDAAAEALKAEYTSVDFAGSTWWFR